MRRAACGLGEKVMAQISLPCGIRKRECDGGVIFEKLQVWQDGVARSGPENMAVDEWLMKRGELVLRIYHWAGEWVSLGYFQSAEEARRIFGDDIAYVRRWTGGGIVDHREDVTYTLVIPRSEELARMKGSGSYCEVHRAVAACLNLGGLACELTAEDGAGDSAACFENPVSWDVISSDGRKLAGAGQKRTREGILHQGSVMVVDGGLDRLAAMLAERVEDFEVPKGVPWGGFIPKYADPGWLGRVV